MHVRLQTYMGTWDSWKAIILKGVFKTDIKLIFLPVPKMQKERHFARGWNWTMKILVWSDSLPLQGEVVTQFGFHAPLQPSPQPLTDKATLDLRTSPSSVFLVVVPTHSRLLLEFDGWLFRFVFYLEDDHQLSLHFAASTKLLKSRGCQTSCQSLTPFIQKIWGLHLTGLPNSPCRPGSRVQC